MLPGLNDRSQTTPRSVGVYFNLSINSTNIRNDTTRHLIYPTIYQMVHRCICNTLDKKKSHPNFQMQWKQRCIPSEITPYSQRVHLNYLMLGSFWRHSITSQWTHKMTHNVRLLWVCNSCPELAVRYSWDHLMHHHAVVAVSSQWEVQTHWKLTAS